MSRLPCGAGYEEAGATAIKLYNREVYTPSAAAAMTAPAPMQLSTAGAAGITAGAPSGSTATLPKPAPVTPASEGIWAWLERLEADLSNAYSMTWEDTPAPSFGVCSIDVKDEGLWGGPFHSLQVSTWVMIRGPACRGVQPQCAQRTAMAWALCSGSLLPADSRSNLHSAAACPTIDGPSSALSWPAQPTDQQTHYCPVAAHPNPFKLRHCCTAVCTGVPGQP